MAQIVCSCGKSFKDTEKFEVHAREGRPLRVNDRRAFDALHKPSVKADVVVRVAKPKRAVSVSVSTSPSDNGTDPKKHDELTSRLREIHTEREALRQRLLALDNEQESIFSILTPKAYPRLLAPANRKPFMVKGIERPCVLCGQKTTWRNIENYPQHHPMCPSARIGKKVAPVSDKVWNILLDEEVD
jgi:hypothetical protein